MSSTVAAARWRVAALLAAVVGSTASAYLLIEYVTGQPGVCLTGSGCDLVRASAFAYPLGIPTPLFGLLFYLAAASLAVRTLDGRPIAGMRPPVALLGLAAAGGVASTALTALEAFVIGAFCSWCVVQALASLALLAGAVRLWRIPPMNLMARSSRTRQQGARALAAERASLMRVGWASSGMAALGLSALLVLGSTNASPGGSHDPSSLSPVGSPRLGSGPVEVVEFADFQCPGCAALAPVIARMAAANEMTLVFRYFPLDSIHANADRSARAAAAAARMGSFWPMSDALFARQNAWKDLPGPDADAFFKALAVELGLDATQWRAAYGSQEVAASVEADRQAAVELGLSGTPTLYIGGVRYGGPLSLEGIRAAIAA